MKGLGSQPGSVRAFLLSVIFSVLIFGGVARGSVFNWGYYYNENGGQNVFIPTQFGLGDDSTGTVAVAGGDGHTLALNSDGTIRVWGDGRLGNVVANPGYDDVIAVAAGAFYSVLLRKDGTVYAWGRNDYGQCTVPDGLSNVVAISASYVTAFALRADGRIVSWGGNSVLLPPDFSTVSNVVSIASGLGFGYAIKADGTIWALGASQPTLPSQLTNVVAIAPGDSHTLALKADGTIFAWGDDTYGQIDVPEGASNIVAVAAGSNHSMALKNDGSVFVWGAGTNIDKTTGTDFGQSILPPGLENVAAIGASMMHSIAVTAEGSPYIAIRAAPRLVTARSTTWLYSLASGQRPLTYQWRFEGEDIQSATNNILALTNILPTQAGKYSLVVSNALGLATNDTVVTVAPFFISKFPAPRSAMVGSTTSFSVEVSGSGPFTYEWFFNGGKLDGATSATLIVTNVQTGDLGNYSVTVTSEFGSITTPEVSLSLTSLAVWGGNASGQTNLPPGLTNVTAVAASFGHVLAAKQDGSVVAWGQNRFGETNVPPDLTKAIAVTAADGSSLALKSDGTLARWGLGAAGGQFTVTNIAAISGGYQYAALDQEGKLYTWAGAGKPTLDTAITSNLVAVAIGGTFGAALTVEGTVVIWGTLPGGPIFRHGTAPPVIWTNIVAIAAGTNHLLGLKADGKVIARGGNTYGQTNVPSGLSNVVAIAAGNSHSLALKADGKIVAWGATSAAPKGTVIDFGQTNVPAYLPLVSQIAAGGYDSLALVEDGPPRLVAPVINRTVLAGSNAVFYAFASGAPPISYQWKMNGTNIPNATNVYLLLTNVLLDRAGNYSIELSNARGKVETQVSTFKVAPLYITKSPTNYVTYRGGTATLSAAATGKTPLRYQWRFKGVDIPKATNATLTLTNLQLDQAGLYDVVISNPYGSAPSAPAEISVGRVAVWGGQNLNGELNLPAGLTNPAAISAAGSHTIVLNGDGSIISWGWNTLGATDVPPGLTDIIQVVAGWNFSMALDSTGNVFTWGNTDPALQFENFIAAAGGGSHSLGLTRDGRVTGAGYDGDGQLSIPAGLTDVVAVSAGGSHSLALTADGVVHSWGYPAAPDFPITNVVAISAGGQHDLALRADGAVIAWGDNTWGQTNVPPTLSNVVAIAAGGFFSAALRSDGKVVEWGDNAVGETNVPPNITNVIAIAVGDGHTVAILGDGPPPPIAPLFSPTYDFSAFNASAQTHSGRVYRLESTDSLNDVNWNTWPLKPGDGRTNIFMDENAKSSRRFYRLRQW